MIVLKINDLVQRMKKRSNGIPKSRGIALDQYLLYDASHSRRGLRCSNRVAQIERERGTRRSAKYGRQLMPSLVAALKSVESASDQ